MSRQHESYRAWRCVLAAVAAGALMGVSVPVFATSAAYPADSVIFGATYGDWSAAWQQWALSMPSAKHPLFDTADCSTGQSGPVWFLGGRYCGTEQPGCQSLPAERTCTVPHGKALYFPIVNSACLDTEAEKGFCGSAQPIIAQMRAYLAGYLDEATDLRVTVDGKPLQGGDIKKGFRVKSPVHPVTLPAGNLLQALDENIPAGTYLNVDDGYYVMLQPLPQGNHTINFHGRFPQQNFTLDFTYRLTVQ
ncbi:MAG TPA: hypothetical protein VNX25_07475 [Verrucomicrobiae bacterium]|nr:hypothetical protein [Verrucomicrobiae bacterium]